VRAVASLSTFFEPNPQVACFLSSGLYQQGYASNVRSLSPLYDLISLSAASVGGVLAKLTAYNIMADFRYLLHFIIARFQVYYLGKLQEHSLVGFGIDA
jgi:hypothetical protein